MFREMNSRRFMGSLQESGWGPPSDFHGAVFPTRVPALFPPRLGNEALLRGY